MKLTGGEIAFLIKFFVIFAAAELLIFFLDFSILENFIAASAGGQFGLPVNGNEILIPDGTFVITSSCTGIVSSSILAAIIFSLRKPELPKKVAIFLAGTVLLVILNYFRVFVVVLAGKEHGIAAGELVHTISWFTTAAFVIVLWYYFTKRITGTKNFAGFL